MRSSSCPPAPPPFNRSSALHLIQTSEPALPETLLPNLTPLRQQLRSLSPTQRQERGRQLSEALQSLDSKPQPSVAHVDPPPSGSSPVFLATVLLAAIALAIWCFSTPSERRKRSLLCLPFALTTIALIGMSSDAAPPSAPQLSLRCPGDTSRITRGQILIDLDPACRKLSRPECHPIYHSTVDTALRFYPTLTLGADHHPAFLDFESAYPTHVGQCAKKQARLPLALV